MPHAPFAAVAALATTVVLAAAPSGLAQISAFDWTLHYTKFQGSAQQLGDVMNLYGPNNHDELERIDVAIWVSTVAPVAAHVSVVADFQNLDWDPHYDAPVTFIDDVMTPITFSPHPTGTYTFELDVEAGQSFGFGVWSADAAEGAGIADFRDLVFTPVTWHDAGGEIDPRTLMVVGAPAGADDFGRSVAALGDLDGDVRPDVAVGAPGSDRVLVYSGGSGATLLDISGPDGFGQVLSGAGDFDDDGVPDILVGLPGADGAFADAGRAEVRSGLDGSLLFAIEGEAAQSALGFSLAPARDVDGDGFDDILVGAPGFSPWTNDGYVLLLGGPTGRLIHRYEIGVKSFGAAVLALGDVDDDGTPDLVASSMVGWAWVLSGATGAIVATAVHTDGGGVTHGPSLAALGDVDGDGRSDFVFGDPSMNVVHFGGLIVCSGATGAVLYHLDGTSFFDLIGREVAGGDFDGDGVPDIAYRTAHYNDDPFGRVLIASGASGFSVTHELRSPLPGFGVALATTSGLDGDSADDLVIGAPGGLGLQLVHALDGNGVPRLSGTGDLSPASPFSVVLENGRPHAPVLLVVSPTRVDLPTKGGVLVPFPTLMLPLATNGAGGFALSSTWPPAIPSGFTLWMQAWMTDADGPWGFSASNGLGAETP